MSLSIVVLLTMPAPAVSAAPSSSCSTPELGATLDQYCETVPTATGPRDADDDDDGGPSLPTSRGRIPANVERRLGASDLGRVLVGKPVQRGDGAVPGRERKRPKRRDALTENSLPNPSSGLERSGGAATFRVGDALAGIPPIVAVLALVLLGAGTIIGLTRLSRSRSA